MLLKEGCLADLWHFVSRPTETVHLGRSAQPNYRWQSVFSVVTLLQCCCKTSTSADAQKTRATLEWLCPFKLESKPVDKRKCHITQSSKNSLKDVGVWHRTLKAPVDQDAGFLKRTSFYTLTYEIPTPQHRIMGQLTFLLLPFKSSSLCI